MSRSAHAGEFERSFRAIADRYDKHYQAWVTNVRERYRTGLVVSSDGAAAAAKYGSGLLTGDPNEGDLIEEHVCSYLLRHTLRTLNWSLNDQGLEEDPVALLREAPVKSAGDRDLRLDYLGYLTISGQPLLVVEAKAPRYSLPVALAPDRFSAASIESAVQDAICNALRGEGSPLNADWRGWLDHARKYVEAITLGFTEAPARYLMSNGAWFVVFKDPAVAFQQSRQCTRDHIQVFSSRDRVIDRKEEFFDALDFFRTRGPVNSLKRTELSRAQAVKDATHVLRGLLVQHHELPRFLGDLTPFIRVSPIAFLRQPSGIMVRVESGDEREMRAEAIEVHLKDVQKSSDALIASIRRERPALPEQSLPDYFQDERSFVGHHGVRRVNPRGNSPLYEVVLGSHSHYLRSASSPLVCDFHELSKCGGKTAKPESRTASVSPAVYFPEGAAHHCAHQDTADVKRLPIMSAPGRRRSQPGFCEIAPFEERLCCRACAFEEVCGAAAEFRNLPCVSGP